MKTLKAKKAHLSEYQTQREETQQRIGRFSEDVYTRRLLHSPLGYIPPVKFEEKKWAIAL